MGCQDRLGLVEHLCKHLYPGVPPLIDCYKDLLGRGGDGVEGEVAVLCWMTYWLAETATAASADSAPYTTG